MKFPLLFMKLLYNNICKATFTKKEVNSINNNLAELRKSKGLSQEELAEKVFVSRQTIISIEKGRYNPSLELAFKLSIYFNTIIENIFTYEEE